MSKDAEHALSRRNMHLARAVVVLAETNSRWRPTAGSRQQLCLFILPTDALCLDSRDGLHFAAPTSSLGSVEAELGLEQQSLFASLPRVKWRFARLSFLALSSYIIRASLAWR